MLLGLLWVKQTNINIKNSSLKQILTLGYILALWLGDRKDRRPVKKLDVRIPVVMTCLQRVRFPHISEIHFHHRHLRHLCCCL